MRGCTTLYIFFCGSRTTEGIEVKLLKGFLGAIFRSKPQPPVAYAYAHMTHFETCSGLKDQLLGILKQLLSFPGQR